MPNFRNNLEIPTISGGLEGDGSVPKHAHARARCITFAGFLLEQEQLPVVTWKLLYRRKSKMSPDTVVRARIDSNTKSRATEALRAMGLIVSDAIRLLLLRVADEKRLPFAIQVPNAATVKAMKELDDGKGQRFDSTKELFQDLNI